MKKKQRILPDGYRNLTPTERIREGDYHTCKSNNPQSESIHYGGWIPSTAWHGRLVKECYPDKFYFCRPKKQPLQVGETRFCKTTGKSEGVSLHPTDCTSIPSGMLPANTSIGQ